MAQLQGQGAVELADLAQESTGSPTGTIVTYASSTIPSSWLECNGAEVSQSTYADLYALIAATYGSAGSGNFKLPDLRGRAVIGAGTGSGLTTRALAAAGGVEAVALSDSEMPQHTHTFSGISHGHSFTGDSHTHTFSGDNHSHTFTGSSHRHSIDHGHSMLDHKHDVGQHDHSIPSHDHSIPTHDHSINSHDHSFAIQVSTSYGDLSGYGDTYVTDVAASNYGYSDDTSSTSLNTNYSSSSDTGSWSGSTGDSSYSLDTATAQIAPDNHSGNSGYTATSGSNSDTTTSGSNSNTTTSGTVSVTTGGGTNSNAGGGGFHDNMTPFLALICIIKT
jgi:microcystin-dependent protein